MSVGRPGRAPLSSIQELFPLPGEVRPVNDQEKSKQEQIDEIEKIEMCGDVIF